MTPYIDIHTHDSVARPDLLSIRNIRLQSADPIIPESEFFCAGIHPRDAGNARQEWLEIFDIHPNRLIAVGETGLDHREIYQPYCRQSEWFERQIGMANRLRKPLIIHSVQAMEETSQTLRRLAEVPALLHGYTGSGETVRQWLQQKPDMYFSFGPFLLRSAKTQEALLFLAREYPDRLFLETDGNKTVTLREIYGAIAELTGWRIERLKEQICRNLRQLFPGITITG